MDKGFTIEFIKEDDADDVLDHMRQFYFKDAPVNVCLQITDCSAEEQYAMRLLKLGFSFKALSSSGKILGVFINGKMSKNDAKAEHPELNENAKIQQALLDYIYSEFNMFATYPDCETAFDASMLCVDSSARGMGIGKALTRRTLDYAKEHKYDLCHCFCTSKFSSDLCEQLGFDRAYSLRYDEYFVDGKNAVLPGPPHERVSIYVKRLQ